MSDIYEQKANKYKYKYLKLKKKYMAEGGEPGNWLTDLFNPITNLFVQDNQKLQDEYNKKRDEKFKEEFEKQERLRQPQRFQPLPLPQQGQQFPLKPPLQRQPLPLQGQQLPLPERQEQERLRQQKERLLQQQPLQGQQQQRYQQEQERLRQQEQQRQLQQLAVQQQQKQERLRQQERPQQQVQQQQEQYPPQAQQKEQKEEGQVRLQQVRLQQVRDKKIEDQVKKPAKLINIKEIINDNNYYFEYDIEYIGDGSFGCVISPPLQFNSEIYIKNLINNNDINNNDKKLKEIFTSKNYVGKLLSCDNEIFNTEYREFLELNEIDPEAKHRSQLIFAAYMNKESLRKNFSLLLNNVKNKIQEELQKYEKTQKYEKIQKQFIELYNCFFNPEKQIINSSSSENYGYIISTRVGKSLIQILNNNKISGNNNIIIFLEKLKESIRDLIQKLYDDESIHGDIKFDNMTMTLNNKGEFDDNSKICFIDFGFKQKYNILNTLITYNHQYPYILQSFKMIINKYKEDDFLTKSELINELIKIENDRKRKNEKYDRPLIMNIIQQHFNNNININYSCFFHSLEDNTKYKLIDFYTKCIKPIAKNIDIYALSLYIYGLFFSFFSDIKSFYFKFNNNQNTFNILKELVINALYNNIDGPEELIIYLEEIINSINNASYYDIRKKIKVRRRNIKEEEKKIQFYYYYFDNFMNIFLAQ